VRNDGREYWLRPRVLELGYAYLAGIELPEAARPFMDDLVDEVGESTSIAVRDDDDIVYAAHVAPHRVMTINVPIGSRDPLYCTALGRVLLAAEPAAEIDRYLQTADLRAHTAATVTDPAGLRQALERVAADGYSLIEDELEDGLVAMAVPVRDANGAVIAAMNLCSYSLRTSPAELAELTYRTDEARSAAREQAERLADDPGRFERYLRNRSATAHLGWNPYLHDPKLPRRLHRVTAPALILWGAQDRLLPVRHARRWAELLPSTHVTVIEDAGHLPLAEQPGASLRAIRSFCGES